MTPDNRNPAGRPHFGRGAAVRIGLPAAVTAVLLLALLAGCTSARGPDLSGMTFTSKPMVGNVIWRDLITEDVDAVAGVDAAVARSTWAGAA